jgi:methylenetetrahydrofolate dehydrogenase (NADP+) / methenyltetrahydrofolate cyclohydrolase
MGATLMDGAALAARLREELKQEIAELGHVGLATVLVGDDPASDIYIRHKHKASDEVGIEAFDKRLPGTTPGDELLELVEELNDDDSVDGILVQTPLPAQIDEARIMRAIDPVKDVDGMHPFSAGQLYLGRQTLVPATPLGIMELLSEYRIQIAGARAVVVGRSPLVGKPIAMLLLQANATVSICHSRTDDLAGHTVDADLLVAAVGQPGVITADMVKQGATVVDVGITRTGEGLLGDVERDVAEVAAFLTPVPGGVGPMTIAALLGNAVRAARYRSGALAFPLICARLRPLYQWWRLGARAVACFEGGSSWLRAP